MKLNTQKGTEEMKNEKKVDVKIDDYIRKRIYTNGISTLSNELLDTYLLILDTGKDLTLATTRKDGWAQANTVGFVQINGDIYFETYKTSSKALNIARDSRVSISITPEYKNLNEVKGLSMGAFAKIVTDEELIDQFHTLLFAKYPSLVNATYNDGTNVYPDENLAVYRLEPVVASILDSTKGMGHADFVVFNED